MRDVDDADVLRFEIFHELEQTASFRESQTRRRLVHDDDACAGDESARDLDQLLLGQRELTEWRGTRNVHSEPSQYLVRLAIDPFAIDQFEKTRGGRFATQEDIRADVEVV